MNRRELTRAYKENPRPAGVFRVTNTATGRVLLGRSVDVPAALNRERAQLRLGSHRNTDLQRDWNAHGADAFTFEVVDTLKFPEEPGYDPTDDLVALEAMWRETLGVTGARSYTRDRQPTR